MKYHFSSSYKNYENQILDIINNFENTGTLFGNGKRNKIKIFDLKDKKLNIKSFKIPNLINKVAYKYFRKSKARRSFEYASILLEKGIGTPQPVAYFENFNFLGLKESYYISEHLEAELTFRELVLNLSYPNHESILRQCTRFIFELHEKGIEFLDNSPGNILITQSDLNKYNFFLVDLNRMNFHQNLNFEQRMNNFNRLTPDKGMIEVMSNEYSKVYTEKTEADIFDKMWESTNQFQEGFRKKKRIKKTLKFWKA